MTLVGFKNSDLYRETSSRERKYPSALDETYYGMLIN